MRARCIVPLLLVAALVSLPASAISQDRANNFEKPKNLQVLPKELTGSEVRQTMFGFTRALGVRCSYCHKGEEDQPLNTYDFAADEKPNKARAREMLRMMADIKGHLAKITSSGGAAVEVSCNTCHRGRSRPTSLHAELSERYRVSNADSAISTYKQLKERYYGHGSFDFNDFALAGFGREVLEKGDVKGAAAVLKLATEEFPSSAFAWSGLADATLRIGDGVTAKGYYEKALQLNPRNQSAQRMLDSLQKALK